MSATLDVDGPLALQMRRHAAVTTYLHDRQVAR
jgi:hypothetical protein